MDRKKYQNEKVISKILKESNVIAIVGVSENISRPSYGVAHYLQSMNYRIIPVNPKYDMVLGEKSYSSLHEIPESVDVVDIFRNPDYVLPLINDAITIGAKAVWLQENVVNEEAAELAADAGLDVVMDRCMLKEHRRLFG